MFFWSMIMAKELNPVGCNAIGEIRCRSQIIYPRNIGNKQNLQGKISNPIRGRRSANLSNRRSRASCCPMVVSFTRSGRTSGQN